MQCVVCSFTTCKPPSSAPSPAEARGHGPVNPEHLPYLLQGVQGAAEQKWDVCSVQGAVCSVLYAVCRLGIRCNQCLCKFCGARVKSMNYFKLFRRKKVGDIFWKFVDNFGNFYMLF